MSEPDASSQRQKLTKIHGQSEQKPKISTARRVHQCAALSTGGEMVYNNGIRQRRRYQRPQTRAVHSASRNQGRSKMAKRIMGPGRLSMLSATLLLPLLLAIGGCDESVSVDLTSYPADTYFALAVTDNAWDSHDVANLVKLDFNGTVQPDTVAPVQVETPPTIDGSGGDGAWSKAEGTELVLDAVRGGCGIVAVTVKCVYTEERIYFLVSWLDPSGTRSDDPGRWLRYDGRWTNRYDDNGDPDPEGELIAEDMLAFFWPIADTYPEFTQEGCAGTCHNNGYDLYWHSAGYGRFLDVWNWGAGRTNPRDQADDYYLTGVFGVDTGVGPYRFNQPVEGFAPWGPLFQHQNDPNANVDFLFVEQAVAYDPHAGWNDGSTVPGYVLHQAADSRGDVEAAGGYSGGSWAVELARDLDTGWPAQDHIFTWEDTGGDGR
ncbi:MAG: hypothetical protein GF403_11730 [Candidatus Coatesbacteria bacterium]|nr:hypothetical protein [Candidatus Coatesbacteria bacterium]